MKPSKRFSIETAARTSPLSRAQVEEIAALWPHIDFQMHWIETTGDKDQTTSLRILGKSDFFTRELDEMLLAKKVRIAIHSAKDLPDPLPQGLCIAALTQGIDPRDCIVLRKGETLKKGMIIATSSERREEAVRLLEDTVRFIDLRGTIAQRLSKLETGEADGVVVAAAALIRLKLSLNCVYLPGPTAPGQGQLAIVCREEDEEIVREFST
jgi:hydroxymethylbilane synthase